MENELREAILRLDTKIDKMKNDLSVSFNKIELLLEKLANFETRIDENNRRIHKRIDDNEHKINDILDKQHSKGCDALNNFIAIRNEMDKYRTEVLKSIEQRTERNEKALQELKDIPNKILFRVVASLVTATIIALSSYWFIEHENKKIEVRK